MKIKSSNVLTVLFTCCALYAAGSSVAKGESLEKHPFNREEYPDNEYHLSRKTISKTKFDIELIEVKRNEPSTESPECRAWITVSNKNRTIDQVYFENMNSIGYLVGLYLPEDQPIPGKTLIVKFGDYDGRLLFVNDLGKISDLPGGKFSLDSSKKYFLTFYPSDGPALIVYSRSPFKKIWSSENEHFSQLVEWHFTGTEIQIQALMNATQTEYYTYKIGDTKLSKSSKTSFDNAATNDIGLEPDDLDCRF